MPSSSVRAFTDTDEHEASLTGNGTVTVTVTERGKFAAKHTQVQLHRLFLRRLSDILGRVLRVDHVEERAGIAIYWPQSGGEY